MIVNRNVQHITSKYGWRKFKNHKGIDLRIIDQYHKILDIVLPEKCLYCRSDYQKKWGWTHVFTPLETMRYGYAELKFTHMDFSVEFLKSKIYEKDFSIGFTETTLHMQSKDYLGHLHFETHKREKINPIKKRAVNPIEYMDLIGIPYE